MRNVSLLVLLLFCSCHSVTPTKTALSDEEVLASCPQTVRDAYDVFHPQFLREQWDPLDVVGYDWAMECANRVESNFIGPGGKPSPRNQAFCTVLESPHADVLFKSLLTNDQVLPGSCIYALCGVYWTDPAFFKKTLPTLRDSEQRVQWQSGCIIDTCMVKNLIPQIESGRLPRMMLRFAKTEEYKGIYKQWQDDNVPKKMIPWSTW